MRMRIINFFAQRKKRHELRNKAFISLQKKFGENLKKSTTLHKEYSPEGELSFVIVMMRNGKIYTYMVNHNDWVRGRVRTAI